MDTNSPPVRVRIVCVESMELANASSRVAGSTRDRLLIRTVRRLRPLSERRARQGGQSGLDGAFDRVEVKADISRRSQGDARQFDGAFDRCSVSCPAGSGLSH